ncbi:UDP-galactose transporter-like 1 [Hondaea fermentalgiana]|uniref:UDP-galactose transporter-like 1 n=1 Tax=Hondaea fermentalgiana TaxID=2315210 RepID=A0A2R5G6Y2_9STRA|nr:UDP-galactose transporter-like 1 [Hondaea fermentalgiana]|eukprot:GBG26812.1 UDP-galactose transporter-like 1 [Hondaea fermentalgiana]
MADATLSTSSFLPEWAESLVTNLGLYFLIFAIGYVAIQQVRKYPVAPSDHSLYAKFVRFMVFGESAYEQVPTDSNEKKSEDPKPEPTFALRAMMLLFCAGGLLGSYLLWGVLQERIMTKEYDQGKFDSSIFLVFCNRLLALVTAGTVISFTEKSSMRAPFYKFSFTSLSNVLSSWSQLEALKYISFPTQVLAKSSKLIPVMLMGKVISGKSYPTYDYVVAIVIGFGVSVFTLNNSEGGNGAEKTTSFSGILLIACYLTFDSFTSQWQGHLFKEYKMSSYQMMFGVNAFSCFFTVCSLLESGELFSSLDFIMKDSTIAQDILMFSVTGATGQMFIFYTIKTFGPLVFTIIMTCRQLTSIVISCIIYGHTISGPSLMGAVIVFGAVGYRIYRQNSDRQQKAAAEKAAKLARESQPVGDVELK